MLIYLAGTDMTFFPKRFGSQKYLGSSRLTSYFYSKETQALLDKQEEVGYHLFLDSGAFSAKSKGISIDIETYAEFIKKNMHLLKAYANLDVIGDPKATFKNHKTLVSLGLNPLPVFHYHSDEKYIRKYLEKGYNHIALGGLVNSAQPKEWLDKIWNEYLSDDNGNPLFKVHGFGVTTHSLLIRYPWDSVDSTTWVLAAAMGEICVPVKRNGKYKYELQPYRVGVTADSMNKNSIAKSIAKLKNREVLNYIEEHDFKIGKSVKSKVSKDHKLKENERWVERGKLIEVSEEEGISNSYMHRRYLNAIYFKKLQKELTKNPRHFNKKSIKRKFF